MADSATCLVSGCTDAGSTKTLKVGREASFFEHPGIVENVVVYLGLYDVLNLGCCSKYLNGVSESDSTWKLLYKRRWKPQAAEDTQAPPANRKGWKAAYINRQKEHFSMILKVLAEVQERIQNDQLSSPAFHLGINHLRALGITYDDIYSLFFSKKLNVEFTMLGLYYAFFFHRISEEALKKAMAQRGVIDKKVCARWTLTRTSRYGYHIPEENYIRVRSLGRAVDMEMSFIYLMCQARQPCLHYQDGISAMSFSCKIPDLFEAEDEIECLKEKAEERDCSISQEAAQAAEEDPEAKAEEECLKKMDHGGEASSSSA
ncbi:F-box-like protein [Rhynchospora pubera]|uniref:F-box-like protein n=1 Tax=Rhynchospora pubera TaxID=906938 RepID=A0AAV8GIF2_9POAL|nr:F-box-like protein [Rhynchospora pubera]